MKLQKSWHILYWKNYNQKRLKCMSPLEYRNHLLGISR
ncbi:IS3 family transposase [Caldicellulosiruptor naganoensis]